MNSDNKLCLSYTLKRLLNRELNVDMTRFNTLNNFNCTSLDFVFAKMRYCALALLICVGGTLGQFSGVPTPWNPASRPSLGGKPNRPSPFGSSSTNSKQALNYAASYNDDPIPANPRLESTYDTQQLPSKLPILAPNGVVEIYNRVVDDLLKRLEGDFKRREIDPMDVVIRPTPAGPVRVPGHLQKRPFRRPGAALYRASIPVMPPKANSKPIPHKAPAKRKSRSPDELPPSIRFPIERPSGEEPAASAVVPEEVKPSFRGVGKISKGPLNEDDEKDSLLPETTTPISTTTYASAVENRTSEKPAEETSSPAEVEDSSEEDEPFFSRARSDEYISNDDHDEPELDLEIEQGEVLEKDKKDATKPEKKNSKKDGSEEEEDEEDLKDKQEGSKDVETLLQRYQNKNTNAEKAGAKPVKYTAPSKEATAAKKKETEKLKNKHKKKPSSKEKEKESAGDDDDEDDDFSDKSDEDDDDDVRYHDDIEPGTLQSGGNRPNGGFYPPGGPPAVPAKPNAQLTGLSKIRRASDVAVSVDARSAVITARLLVGPLHVVINDSVEPLERNVRATIPELEAEILLMERHGVVFLQRFTLDRAYGQDVEISIPKNKDNKKKGANINKGPVDAMQAGAQQRYQTKMAAHISMEIVKLLRSGNLRVNLMRTAQSSMSKLKLPIQKPKKSKKKSKKTDKNKTNNNENDN